MICEPVPSSVKDILERALMLQERVIFNDIFDRQIKKSSPGPLAAVVTLFNTALDKYLKIREGFSEGTKLQKTEYRTPFMLSMILIQIFSFSSSASPALLYFIEILLCCDLLQAH